jgi:predicted HicB family RNase H-like nuclease
LQRKTLFDHCRGKPKTHIIPDGACITGTIGGKTMDKPMTYKGYSAKIEYSDKEECLIGRISNIEYSITFHVDSVKEIRQAFEEAVDAYLEGCAQRNEAPEKPSDNRTVVRVSPALHSVLALVAGRENKSVNTWLAEVVN